MTRRRTLRATIKAFIGLNIQIEDQGQNYVFTLSFLPVTPIFVLVSFLSRLISRRQRYTPHTTHQSQRPPSGAPRLPLACRLHIAAILCGIGCRATLYGLGVNV